MTSAAGKRLAPLERRSVEPAGITRRLLGGLIDWSLCLGLFIGIWLFAAIGLAVAFELLVESGEPMRNATGRRPFALATPVSMGVLVVYFAYFWAKDGQTPGMALTDIRLLQRGGAPLTPVRAFLRASLAVLGAVASAVIVVGSPTVLGPGILRAAQAILAVLLVGHAWMLVDRNRETLQDKVFRLRAVRD